MACHYKLMTPTRRAQAEELKSITSKYSPTLPEEAEEREEMPAYGISALV